LPCLRRAAVFVFRLAAYSLKLAAVFVFAFSCICLWL
jgi:hypothetical protein